MPCGRWRAKQEQHSQNSSLTRREAHFGSAQRGHHDILVDAQRHCCIHQRNRTVPIDLLWVAEVECLTLWRANCLHDLQPRASQSSDCLTRLRECTRAIAASTSAIVQSPSIFLGLLALSASLTEAPNAGTTCKLELSSKFRAHHSHEKIAQGNSCLQKRNCAIPSKLQATL